MLYGLENGIDYDPYSESPEEDTQSPFFYGPPNSGAMDGYSEHSPVHGLTSAGMYYSSAYYRPPTAYALGSYFMPPSAFTQNTTMGKNMFGFYSGESAPDNNMQ